MKVRRGFVNHSFQQGPAAAGRAAGGVRGGAAASGRPGGAEGSGAPAAGRRVLPRPRPWLARRLGEAARPRCAAAAAGCGGKAVRAMRRSGCGAPAKPAPAPRSRACRLAGAADGNGWLKRRRSRRRRSCGFAAELGAGQVDRIGGAAGYRFGDVRVEGEGVYLPATLNRYTGMDIDKGTIDTQPGIGMPALIGNGWYDIDAGTIVCAFLGWHLPACPAPSATPRVAESGIARRRRWRSARRTRRS